MVYLLFFLTKKVTKKSSEFDLQQCFNAKSPLTNSHLEEFNFRRSLIQSLCFVLFEVSWRRLIFHCELLIT